MVKKRFQEEKQKMLVSSPVGVVGVVGVV